MKQTFFSIITAVLATVFAGQVGFSQDAAGPVQQGGTSARSNQSEADLTAIREQSEAFVLAFNHGDAKAVAAFWTEDGEYIDDVGRRFAGRDAIEQGYAEFFAGNPNVQIRIAIDSLRLVSPDAAIEDGIAVVEPSPVGVSGTSTYTAVHVKAGEKWLMASVRDTWTETPPAVRSAADLEWLVGTWAAEEHGVQTESVCRWVAGDRFIERRYTTTHLDGSKTTGLQVIGWNPQGGHVQSWDFSPDGGHAVGAWSPTEGGWQAEVHGMTGDGTATAAVNTLRRLDENAYVWQSLQRALGDVAIPDTDEVIIKRVPDR